VFVAYERSKCALEILQNPGKSINWGSPLLSSLAPPQYGRFAERVDGGVVADSDTLIGQTVSHYRIIEKLAQLPHYFGPDAVFSIT
jgi:hypothetical protein